MSNSNELHALEKQTQALKLRQAGTSYEDIAKALGYKGPSGAYQAVKSAMKKTLQEPADELRKLEASRLDEALRAIWPQVKKGNLLAIDRYIKISERRAKIMGMEAKSQVEISGAVKLEDLDGVRAKRWEAVRDQLKDILGE
jgi:hypothetical protein